MGITIVNQYERVVVFRWGQYKLNMEQGFHWLWPIMDRGVRVDLREQVERVPTQKYITKDNVVVDMDFVLYYRVLSDTAERSVIAVTNHHIAVRNQSVADLRNIIGTITLSEALGERERIRDMLQEQLDEVTGRWGVKVEGVAINEIEPPPGVKDAMDKQKSADALKIAAITESEGDRQAQINRAEGEKQAAILSAEAVREAEILKAEGARQAAILNAEGYSNALTQINQVAQTADSRTMGLQYLETLNQLGQGESTKFIFPLEFTNLLQSFLGSKTQNGDDSSS